MRKTMTSRRWAAIVLPGLLALSACSTNTLPEERSAQALAEMNKQLAGKTAGKPINCLPPTSSNNMQVIDERAVLYHVGRTVYVNELRGGCSGLGQPGNTLVTTSFGGAGLCNGDIARVVDLSTGIYHGSCAMGPFVPYAPPR